MYSDTSPYKVSECCLVQKSEEHQNGRIFWDIKNLSHSEPTVKHLYRRTEEKMSFLLKTTELHKVIVVTVGGRHSSVVSSVAIIMRPRVRIPSTPSMLFSIFSVEIVIEMRKGRKRGRDWPFIKRSYCCYSYRYSRATEASKYCRIKFGNVSFFLSNLLQVYFVLRDEVCKKQSHIVR